MFRAIGVIIGVLGELWQEAMERWQLRRLERMRLADERQSQRHQVKMDKLQGQVGLVRSKAREINAKAGGE